MKKAVIVFSAMLISGASFCAAAQTSDWFAVKHPEMKTMERMRAGQVTGASARARPAAQHQTAARSFGDGWYAVKHPEIKIMERMRMAEAGEHGKVAMHGAGGRQAGHDSPIGLHRS